MKENCHKCVLDIMKFLMIFTESFQEKIPFFDNKSTRFHISNFVYSSGKFTLIPIPPTTRAMSSMKPRYGSSRTAFS
jgi:hypothetical protein